MDTLKTAVVVLLLLAVLYGVYVVLDKPALPPTPDIAWHQQKANEPLQIDEGKSLPSNAVPGTNASARGTSPPAALGAGGFAASPLPSTSLPAPNLLAETSNPMPGAKPEERAKPLYREEGRSAQRDDPCHDRIGLERAACDQVNRRGRVDQV